MAHSIDSAVHVSTSTSILAIPAIPFESISNESTLKESVNESETEDPNETTSMFCVAQNLELYNFDIKSVFVSLIDNEENHDLLAEVARLRDEKSQLVKEIQELKEGQREIVGAKFQDLQAQAAKKGNDCKTRGTGTACVAKQARRKG